MSTLIDKLRLIFICIVAFMNILAAQDSTEVVILSPKVGEVIDASEREHYRLFPSVRDFVSAVIVKLPNGKFEARIKVISPTAKDSISIEIPESMIYILAEKIEYFEELKAGPQAMGTHRLVIQVGSKLVERIYNPENLRNRNENEYTEKQNIDVNKTIITTRSGIQHSGYMLYITDSALVIWESIGPYNRNKLNDFAVVLHFFEIDRVVIEKESKILSGMGKGFLIGGGVGAIIGFASGSDEEGLIRFSAGAKAFLLGSVLGVCGAFGGGVEGALEGIDDDFTISGNSEKYKAIVPSLREKSFFPSVPPPELQTLLVQKSEELSPHFEEPIIPASAPPSEPSTARFHLSIGRETWLMIAAHKNIIDAFNSSGFGGYEENWLFGGTIDYPIDYSKYASWNVGVEYNLTDYLRLGLTLDKIPQQEIHGIDEEYEYAQGTSYSLLVEYVPAPVPLLFTSRSEFAIAAGVSYNSLCVDGTLSALFGSGIINQPITFAVKKNVFGLHSRISYDYYISRYLSIQLKGEGKLISSIDVPAVSHTNPDNNIVKTLKQHTVNFSGIDFSIGLRFHL